MRRPLAYSVVLHLAVIGIVAFGLPALAPPPLIVEEPMVVELVPLDERVNPPPATRPAPVPEAARPATPRPARDERPEPLPKPAEPKAAARPEPAPAPLKPAPPKTEPRPEPPRSAPKPEPKAEKPEPKPQPAKPEPPKPEPAKAEPRPAAPKPEAPKPEPKAVARAEPEEPKPQVKPKPPEPRAEAKAEQKPEQKPQPKPEKAEPKVAPAERKTEPAKPSPPATAQRKPEPGDDFASVLKTVDELKQSGRTEAKPSPPPARKAETGDPEFGAQVAQALRSAGPSGNKPALPVTASEIDAVRRQIERCWNLPAGVKDAGDLVVSIRVEMNADGTPRSAVVDGSSRGQGNPLFQATADSARRAVLNPRCHPFKLPPDKFDRWRTMTLIFNPREMAGT